MADKHECIIGLLNTSDYDELTTLADLKNHIEAQLDFNEYLRREGYPEGHFLYNKVWSLMEYGDWRRSTDLSRFNYCPECGAKIDWKKIRDGEHDG